MVTENTEPIGDEVTPAAQPETDSTERLFTQDEVNRLMGQRAKEVRNQFGD